MNGTGIAGAQDNVAKEEGTWRCATCGKEFYSQASALAWISSEGLQQQCKQCYSKRNTYSQRDWDRTVGWGNVPKEYSNEADD